MNVTTEQLKRIQKQLRVAQEAIDKATLDLSNLLHNDNLLQLRPHVGMDTKERVIEALKVSGYECEDIIVATFLNISEATGKEVHKITFENSEGKIEEGLVYVEIKDGKLKGEF